MIWGEIFLENSSFNNHHNFWGLIKFQFDCCDFNTDHTLSIYLYLLIYPWRQKLHTTTSYAISSLKYSSFCIQCFLLVVTLFRDGDSHKFSLLKMISLLPSSVLLFFLLSFCHYITAMESRNPLLLILSSSSSGSGPETPFFLPSGPPWVPCQRYFMCFSIILLTYSVVLPATRCSGQNKRSWDSCHKISNYIWNL